jgi:hypothetical protein
MNLIDASQSQIPGESAEVQGVVSIGRQAGHVYFVARGVLIDVPNGEGEVALKGSDNLYEYDTQTEQTTFVADLCSGLGKSGSAADPRCPGGQTPASSDATLWSPAGVGEASAQAADDGRYLVFSSVARLVGHGTQVDIDAARDVYRYDAETKTLDRVSLGEYGNDANGNAEGFIAAFPTVGIDPGGRVSPAFAEQELATRAISEDGSIVVFTSVEPLSVDAINGQQNVYVWREGLDQSEGAVSMISSGSSLTGDGSPVISTSGNDVFFGTSQGLVVADTEGDDDVYDARVGGGFPQKPAERQQCSSDACQGPLSDPAPLLVPNSVTEVPGQNFSPPTKARKQVKTHKKTVKTKHRDNKRRLGRRGKKPGQAAK